MKHQESWKIVWESKTSKVEREDLLGSLIKANGFDTGCGDYSTDQWKLMTIELSKLLGIKEKSKVLEVGCGSGAFLHGIQNYSQAEVFGYDYSSALINTANEFVKGEFKVSEASKNPFNSIKFDFAISHSVFQYFPNEDYAIETIKSMSNALNHGGKIALLDINDADSEKTYHTDRRMNYKNPAEYDEKYKNHPHLFLQRKVIISSLENLGFVDIEFIPHFISEYKNSKYRFNIIATKT